MEHFSELKLYEKTLSRKERVEFYLADNPGSESAQAVAEDFYNPEKPLADTVILIPVALEQDAVNIENALAEYAKQRDCKPFSIGLLLNYRIDAIGAPHIDEAIDTAERTIATYADKLDVRYSLGIYDEPKIGLIRKELWDGALLLSHAEGKFDDLDSEVIGINHDIDTESISPHYIRNIQNQYDNDLLHANARMGQHAVLSPSFTEVSHRYPFDTHPNTAGGMYWFDTSYRQRRSGYEEGVTVPLTYYAKAGGFNENATTAEMITLMRKADSKLIRGTGMKTSPRRYVDRFPDNGYTIWTNETFSDNDTCRDGTEKRDATHEELESHVLKSLQEHLSWYAEFGLESVYDAEHYAKISRIRSDDQLDTFIEECRDKLTHRLRVNFALASRTLRSIGLPTHAELADEEAKVEQRVNQELVSLRFTIREENGFIWQSNTPRQPSIILSNFM